VLVDAGTYLYHAGGAWRSRFRHSALHNTLTLDGASQSRMSGPFNWSAKARAYRLPERCGMGTGTGIGTGSGSGQDGCVQARHNGYRRRTGLWHERRLRQSARGFVLEDRLLGRARRDPLARWTYMLHPTVELRHERCGITLLRDGAAIARVTARRGGSPLPLRSAVRPYSPSFGVLDQTSAIHLSLPARAVGPQGVAWHWEVS
jgi:uncharacterized heparinase superfamily protein